MNGRIDYRIQDAQQAAINRSYEGRAYYYRNSFFGSSDETTIILKATERAITQKGCSVILIDNLMSALVDPGQDLNGAQTEFVRKLANMSQFYGVCILLLVHPRKSRNSGRASIENDDIMGSGNITNLASVVLAYGNPPEMMGRGDRAIYVLKNRLYGDELKGQDGINVWFDPVTKRITDVQGNFTWDSDESPRFVPAEEHDENLPF